MAFADKKGIALTSGFKLQAETPLDARLQVQTLAERDELVTIHAAYEGMNVYVIDEKKTYEYKGNSVWEASVTGVAYIHPTTPGNKHIPAGGAAGQILDYAADGTAKWITPDKKTVGLDKVDNTADLDKPISTAAQAALDDKVDKVTGKGLSEADFTNVEKEKLAGIAENANNYTHPANHPATMITEDATHRFMTDAERTKWNAKANVVLADKAPASAPVGTIGFFTTRPAV